MKVIAVDYDDTYTADPELFESFISTAKTKGHVVVIVTFRNGEVDPLPSLAHEVFYTSGTEKANYMKEVGLEVDIWVDDWPELIGKTR
jgi:hypothetical protein